MQINNFSHQFDRGSKVELNLKQNNVAVKSVWSLITSVIFSATVIGFTLASGVSTIHAQLPVVEAPSGLTIDLINDNDVIILWEQSANPEVSEYVVLRSDEPDEQPSEFARIDASETSFIDTEVEVGETYTYGVQAAAAGFLSGEPEYKSIVVELNTRFGSDGTAGTGESDDSTETSTTTNTQEGEVRGQSTAFTNSGRDQRFWLNLISLNMMIIGVVGVTYMLLRQRLVRNIATLEQTSGNTQDYPGSNTNQMNSQGNVTGSGLLTPNLPGNRQSNQESRAKTKTGAELNVNPAIKAKMGRRDVNIPAAAKKKYLEDRGQKLKEWVDEAKDEPAPPSAETK